MESLIIFAIFYILFGLFDKFMKGAKNKPARPPVKSQGQPPSNPEDDIPPFLRQLLGMEPVEKPKRPSTSPASVPTAAPRKVEQTPAENYFPEDYTSSYKTDIQAHVKDAGTFNEEPVNIKSAKPLLKEKAKKKSPFGLNKQFLRNKKELKKAIVLKEIFDKPLSLRGRHSPYMDFFVKH